MQALLEAKLPCEIAAVISNRADASGLEIAQQYGIATAVVSHKDFSSREAFDTALAVEIDRHQPDFVILAGFMRILTADFVNHYAARLINIHPSLLPAFTGVNTHERALQEGVKIHGCTVHFVTAELDHGPIIIQSAVPVLSTDTVKTLSSRVLHEEHRVFPQAVRWLCTGNIQLGENGRVILNRMEQVGTTLISPGLD